MLSTRRPARGGPVARLSCVAGLVLAASTAHGGPVLFVDASNPNCPGSGTELDPFCAIQTAILAAPVCCFFEISVAPGFYFENINFLGKAITLRSQAGPAATIINGLGFGPVVTANSFFGPPFNIVLDGFTVTGGMAIAPFVGGGMEIKGSPTVTNCNFVANTAPGLFGGGMSIDGSPTVTNCTFVDNSTFDPIFLLSGVGGAIFVSGGGPTIVDCTFTRNIAALGGAIAFLFPTGTSRVAGCTFVDNEAFNPMGESAGGAIFMSPDETYELADCTFNGNFADGSEGTGVMNHIGNLGAAGLLTTSQGDKFVNLGILSPGGSGASIGSLEIAMPYTQESELFFGSNSFTGTLLIHLAGTTPGTGYDQAILTSQTELDGLLAVELVDPFVPQLGDVFDIVLTDAAAATYDLITLPALPSDLFLRVENDPLDPVGTVVRLVVDALERSLDFEDPESVAIAGLPSAAAVGDFDGQNGNDLAVTIPQGGSPGSVVLFPNRGLDPQTGRWLGFDAPLPPIPVGVDPSAITTGFFSGDAHLDIAVTNAADDDVSILINNGDLPPTFTRLADVRVGTGPRAIAAGDFTEDGHVDLAVANTAAGTVTLLANDGNRVPVFTPFGAPLNAGSAPIALALDDLDDNKCLDMALANRGSGTVSVFLNGGGGSFGAPITLSVGIDNTSEPADLAIEDFDGNGFNDIVTANKGQSSVSVLLNNGDGTFGTALNLEVGGLPRSITAADLELDGDPDIVVISNDETGTPIAQVLRNDLNGGQQLIFVDAAKLVTGTDPAFVITGNLDGDLDEDLITVNEGLGAPAGAGSGGTMAPPGPPVGSVNVSLNALGVVVPLDIEPGDCPNEFKPRTGNSGQRIDIALVGTAEFDVREVDFSTILLSRADGVGGSVAPDRVRVKDRATPFEGEPCGCHEQEKDGIDDLRMRFSVVEMTHELELDLLGEGAEVGLIAAGELFDGTPFTASDCVLIVDPPGDDESDDESDEDSDDESSDDSDDDSSD